MPIFSEGLPPCIFREKLKCVECVQIIFLAIAPMMEAAKNTDMISNPGLVKYFH